MLFLFDAADNLIITIVMIVGIYWSMLVVTEIIMTYVIVSDNMNLKKIIFLLKNSTFSTGFVYYFIIVRNLETKNKYLITFTPFIIVFGIFCAIALFNLLFKYYYRSQKNKK